jgi:hypothetical protein
MARILRAKSLLSPKTPSGVSRVGTGLRAGPSWGPEALRRVTSKASVRRLMARDPLNYLTRDDAVFDQFTNNPNVKYDPSRSPGSVQTLDGTPVPPQGNPTAGHQKVIRRTLFNQNLGKRLRRR